MPRTTQARVGSPPMDHALVTAVLVGAGRVAATTPALPPSAPTTMAVQRMLLVSLRLFAERGFHGTTVRDIARDLAVKPASLYSLVESKEQILADLVWIGHDAHARFVQQSVDGAGGPPAARLAAFVDAHVRFHARWPMLAVVTNTELHCLSQTLASPSLEVRLRTAQLLHSIIESGRRERTFDVRDTLLAAAAIAAMGMRVATWFDGDASREDEVATEYVRLALRVVDAHQQRT